MASVNPTNSKVMEPQRQTGKEDDVSGSGFSECFRLKPTPQEDISMEDEVGRLSQPGFTGAWVWPGVKA